MKKCPNCGVSTADDAASCANCGQSLASVEPVASAPGAGKVRRRPDGTTLIGFGGLSIGLSVILLLIFLFSRGNGSPGMAYYYGSGGGSWFLALLAQGLFSIGILTTLTGAVVRALWFLPGPDSKRAP
jgi:hypothetical protein